MKAATSDGNSIEKLRKKQRKREIPERNDEKKWRKKEGEEKQRKPYILVNQQS